jgi:DNA-binding XRE family transcriptional regulator
MGAMIRAEKQKNPQVISSKVNVRSLREKTHLTQNDFARMMGVSLRTLQNWEQGRREPEGSARELYYKYLLVNLKRCSRHCTHEKYRDLVSKASCSAR